MYRLTRGWGQLQEPFTLELCLQVEWCRAAWHTGVVDLSWGIWLVSRGCCAPLSRSVSIHWPRCDDRKPPRSECIESRSAYLSYLLVLDPWGVCIINVLHIYLPNITYVDPLLSPESNTKWAMQALQHWGQSVFKDAKQLKPPEAFEHQPGQG